jgi:septum formation protein
VISELILASASPVRARLLLAAGLKVSIEPAMIDEASLKEAFYTAGRGPGDCAVALAEAKAREVAARCQRALVIGADQMLVCDSAWFDKPLTLDRARAQLQALRGRTHELVTAVCVVKAATLLWHAESRPRLTMRAFSDTFLDDYIAAEGSEVLGSVGAYRLEGRGVQLFERIDGDYFAILGLPLMEVLGFLRDYGAVQA